MISSIALSALNTSFTTLRSTANNIANSSTPGFKQTRVNQVEATGGGSRVSNITQSSGAPTLNHPGNTNSAEIFSGHLESSNVNLEQQLTQLIAAKHEVQANAKLIKTEDEMLGTLFKDKA